jgi:hypothetical protein
MKSTEQPSNEDNLKNYKSRVGQIVKDTGQSYWDAVKEGMEILAREEKAKIIPLPVAPKKDPGEELKKKLTADTSNPYEKARIKVLIDMPPMAKAEIIAMEASGNKDHYRYKEFIRQIIEEAEKNG